MSVVDGSPAWRAGLRSGDVVTAVGERKITTYDGLMLALRAPGDHVLHWRRYSVAPEAPLLRSVQFEELSGTVSASAFAGVGSWDCRVREARPGSPAEEMGLEVGDVVLSLDGRPCRFWSFLGSVIDQAPTSEHTLVWAHEEEIIEVTRDQWIASVVSPTASDPDRTIRTFGLKTEHGLFKVPDAVANSDVMAVAVHTALTETHKAIFGNVVAIFGLFAGDVSMKELSGPIGIAQLASQTGERGWGYFFQLMVWLSVSLGLINLLPIPVLDGGHILFLAIEAVRRRPVSLRTRQIATYVGLAFIILLMVLVMKNDIERPWG